MITKVVKTKNNTYNALLNCDDGVTRLNIKSIDGEIDEEYVTGMDCNYINLVKDCINRIECRNIFQEELFKKWDGIID